MRMRRKKRHPSFHYTSLHTWFHDVLRNKHKIKLSNPAEMSDRKILCTPTVPSLFLDLLSHMVASKVLLFGLLLTSEPVLLTKALSKSTSFELLSSSIFWTKAILVFTLGLHPSKVFGFCVKDIIVFTLRLIKTHCVCIWCLGLGSLGRICP